MRTLLFFTKKFLFSTRICNATRIFVPKLKFADNLRYLSSSNFTRVEISHATRESRGKNREREKERASSLSFSMIQKLGWLLFARLCRTRLASSVTEPAALSQLSFSRPHLAHTDNHPRPRNKRVLMTRDRPQRFYVIIAESDIALPTRWTVGSVVNEISRDF